METNGQSNTKVVILAGGFGTRLAEQGYLVIGYDMNAQNIQICHMLNELSNLWLFVKFADRNTL